MARPGPHLLATATWLLHVVACSADSGSAETSPAPPKDAAHPDDRATSGGGGSGATPSGPDPRHSGGASHAGHGGEPTAAGQGGEPAAGGHSHAGGSMSGGGGPSGGSSGGGASGGGAPNGGGGSSPTVGGCADSAYQNRSAPGADRAVIWDFGIGTDAERCLIVEVGQSAIYSGNFSIHPLLASGGDSPNPFGAVTASGEDATAVVTFETEGTFGFVCGIHSTMRGAVRAVPAE